MIRVCFEPTFDPTTPERQFRDRSVRGSAEKPLKGHSGVSLSPVEPKPRCSTVLPKAERGFPLSSRRRSRAGGRFLPAERLGGRRECSLTRLDLKWVLRRPPSPSPSLGYSLRKRRESKKWISCPPGGEAGSLTVLPEAESCGRKVPASRKAGR